MVDLDVVAVLKAKPGSEAVVQAALEALVPPTRAEAGCIAYDLFVSAAEPGTFVTVEKWTSQAELDAHLGTPHVQAALGAAGDHLARMPEIHPLIPTDA